MSPTCMISSRFERGDAASFEEVIVSLRHRFGQQNYSEDFHKLLKDPGVFVNGLEELFQGLSFLSV